MSFNQNFPYVSGDIISTEAKCVTISTNGNEEGRYEKQSHTLTLQFLGRPFALPYCPTGLSIRAKGFFEYAYSGGAREEILGGLVLPKCRY